jgi:hypothetical protein
MTIKVMAAIAVHETAFLALCGSMLAMLGAIAHDIGWKVSLLSLCVGAALTLVIWGWVRLRAWARKTLLAAGYDLDDDGRHTV